MPQAPKTQRLRPQTLAAFDSYIREAEMEEQKTLRVGVPFLWSDACSERIEQVRAGKIVVKCQSGQSPVSVPNGLIHDWIGAAIIPGANISKTLALIQDYDNHKNVYQPEVIASKLISRNEDNFEIYLRLVKKKIITVVLDTYHHVQYRSLDRTRWVCRSRTTRIAEVVDAGRPEQKVMPPDTGHGFLWRLYSRWRFEERDSGVYTECRAISLTRDVPFGLGWAIEPIIHKLPEESLIRTLEATRTAIQTRES